MKIEAGKWYKMRNGNPAFVGYAIEGIEWPMQGYRAGMDKSFGATTAWKADGQSSVPAGSYYDLIEEWKEPKAGVRYINIYEEERGEMRYRGQWPSRESADDNKVHELNRIACVRVEWKEGQFDE